jgi:ubiquinone/menaquinone biosynthesis C-methylase UbiE
MHPCYEINVPPANQCEACGGVDFRVIIANMAHEYSHEQLRKIWKYSVMQCNVCRMVFVAPKPSLQVLGTFYKDDYAMYNIDTVDPEREAQSLKYNIAKWRFAKHQKAKEDVLAIISTIIGVIAEVITGRTVSYTLGIPLQLSVSTQIMDFGFGTGGWLLSMRHIGYNALHGYDIDNNEKNIKRLALNEINVSTGDFLSNHYPDNYYDLIRLEHVFEHLLRPNDVLSKLYRMVKPGGSLVMTFPSSEGMSFRLSPTHCSYSDFPRHLFLHTKQSALKMLSLAGFKFVQCRTFSVGLDLEATVNNVLKSRNVYGKFCFGSMIAPLYKIFGTLCNCGDIITIMAVK